MIRFKNSTFPVLNSLARINQTVDTGSSDLVLDALQSSEACLRNIDPAYADKYLSALKTVKTNKTRVKITLKKKKKKIYPLFKNRLVVNF